MKFGDYLRQAREAKSWNQPEAAQKIEIEQSYLSKLETGKSYPSEEVFDRLVKVYGLNMDEMTLKVFSDELDKLREVKQLRTAILHQTQKARAFSMKWMIAGLLFLFIGGASLGLHQLAIDVSDEEYVYVSKGVIRPGEPLNVFDILKEKYPPISADYTAHRKLQAEMVERIDEDYIRKPQFYPKDFVENVEGGKRLYTLNEIVHRLDRSPLRWFLVPALGFLFGAAGCFFISFRRGR